MRLPFLLLGAGGYGVGKSIEYHLTDVNTDSEAKGSLLKTILDFVALSKSSGGTSGSGSLAAITKGCSLNKLCICLILLVLCPVCKWRGYTFLCWWNSSQQPIVMHTVDLKG